MFGNVPDFVKEAFLSEKVRKFLCDIEIVHSEGPAFRMLVSTEKLGCVKFEITPFYNDFSYGLYVENISIEAIDQTYISLADVISALFNGHVFNRTSKNELSTIIELELSDPIIGKKTPLRSQNEDICFFLPYPQRP